MAQFFQKYLFDYVGDHLPPLVIRPGKFCIKMASSAVAKKVQLF